MASADLKKEPECPVCQNIYTDLVTLTCGHNICSDCVGHVMDTQEGSGEDSCPQCIEKFWERPTMRRNMTLHDIAEECQTAQPHLEDHKIFCTYCIHTAVPAVKSCLMCEASLCDDHLRVHSKSPEHVLCDPTTSLQKRKCPVHKKILEYYCSRDDTCICMSCWVIGEHKGHAMESLDEASEKKKRTLRNVQQKLMMEREETEKRVRSLEERRRKVQGEAAGETQRVTALIRDLRRRLEDLEKRVLSEFPGRAERISIHLSDMIQELQIKKDELSRKMHHIEELCNMTDPLTVLQESDTGDLCDTEDGDDEDRERRDNILHDGDDEDRERRDNLHDGDHEDRERRDNLLHDGDNEDRERRDNLVHDGDDEDRERRDNLVHDGDDEDRERRDNLLHDGDDEDRERRDNLLHDEDRGRHDLLLHDGGGLDVAGILHMLHMGLSDIMSGVNVQECSGAHVYPHSSRKSARIIAGPCSPCPQPTPTIQHSYLLIGEPNVGAVQQTWGVSGVTDILLDVNTAGNYLRISDDGRTVSFSRRKKYPETPERFQSSQVLSIQGFSSGQHSWEVDVGKTNSWIVGMSYPSIDRTGGGSEIGNNKKSWGLERSRNEYSAIHDGKEIPLLSKVTSMRVGIDLDYEAGRISFYDLCDPIRHLHTFTTTFTEPLHVGLFVGEGRKHSLKVKMVSHP